MTRTVTVSDHTSSLSHGHGTQAERSERPRLTRRPLTRRRTRTLSRLVVLVLSQAPGPSHCNASEPELVTVQPRAGGGASAAATAAPAVPGCRTTALTARRRRLTPNRDRDRPCHGPTVDSPGPLAAGQARAQGRPLKARLSESGGGHGACQ